MTKMLIDYYRPTTQYEIITEDRARLPSGVLMRVAGKSQACDTKNENNRIYPRKVWEKVLGSVDFKERLASRQMVGNLGHPKPEDEERPELTSHIVTEVDLAPDGTINATYDILETPHGQIAATMFRAGVRLGTSSRGRGSVKHESGSDCVQDDYEAETWDFVINPSTPGAYPSRVSESIESKQAGSVLKQLVEAVSTSPQMLEKCVDLAREISDWGLVASASQKLVERADEIDPVTQAQQDQLRRIEQTLGTVQKDLQFVMSKDSGSYKCSECGAKFKRGKGLPEGGPMACPECGAKDDAVTKLYDDDAEARAEAAEKIVTAAVHEIAELRKSKTEAGALRQVFEAILDEKEAAKRQALISKVTERVKPSHMKLAKKMLAACETLKDVRRVWATLVETEAVNEVAPKSVPEYAGEAAESMFGALYQYLYGHRFSANHEALAQKVRGNLKSLVVEILDNAGRYGITFPGVVTIHDDEPEYEAYSKFLDKATAGIQEAKTKARRQLKGLLIRQMTEHFKSMTRQQAVAAINEWASGSPPARFRPPAGPDPADVDERPWKDLSDTDLKAEYNKTQIKLSTEKSGPNRHGLGNALGGMQDEFKARGLDLPESKIQKWTKAVKESTVRGRLSEKKLKEAYEEEDIEQLLQFGQGYTKLGAAVQEQFEQLVRGWVDTFDQEDAWSSINPNAVDQIETHLRQFPVVKEMIGDYRKWMDPGYDESKKRTRKPRKNEAEVNEYTATMKIQDILDKYEIENADAIGYEWNGDILEIGVQVEEDSDLADDIEVALEQLGYRIKKFEYTRNNGYMIDLDDGPAHESKKRDRRPRRHETKDADPVLARFLAVVK